MQDETTLQRLARAVLEEDPIDWIRRKREQDMTWQQIADQLGEKLGSEVSRETVRIWSAQSDLPESA